MLDPVVLFFVLGVVAGAEIKVEPFSNAGNSRPLSSVWGILWSEEPEKLPSLCGWSTT